MAYTPQTWHDSPTADTPIDAARLGVIETGIVNASLKLMSLSVGGTLPSSAADTADVPVIMPANLLLTKMKCVCKTAPSGAMTVQLRRSTDSGATWSNVSGFLCTFTSSVLVATVDPSDVAVNENDLLGFSITSNGSGTNLLVEVISSI